MTAIGIDTGSTSTAKEPSWGIFFNDSKYGNGYFKDSSAIVDRNVLVSQRVWFCDGKSPKYGTQYGLLYSYYKASGSTDYWARFHTAHNGRGNIATWDGHVASTDADSMKDYYQPFIASRTQHYSQALVYYISQDSQTGEVLTPYN